MQILAYLQIYKILVSEFHFRPANKIFQFYGNNISLADGSIYLPTMVNDSLGRIQVFIV